MTPFVDWEADDMLANGGTGSPGATPPPGGGAWSVTTDPACEPVTLQEVKDFAEIDATRHDAAIENIFIPAAREGAENYMGRSLITRTITYNIDAWPSSGRLVLPAPPMLDVASINTLDADGDATLWADTNYYLDTTSEPGVIVAKTTTPTTERSHRGIIIVYTAGYEALPSAVPAAIRTALLAWTADIFESKIAFAEPPARALKALAPYRILRI
jgi:uncharacterized phiE125 gp8 family phage protein